MKILHIISGDLWAGAEVQAFTLLTTLSRDADIEVAAVLLTEGELSRRLRDAGIPVTILFEQTLSAFQLLQALRALMREWQPQIVHTHRFKENILGAIANRLSVNATCIRTAHGATETAPKGLKKLPQRLIAALDRWCGTQLQHKTIAVTRELAQKLARDMPKDHIVVIENGINLSAVEQAARHIPELFESSKTHIGIVGRLVPVKRVDLFIEIAAYLCTHDLTRDWQFHIFGDGPLRDRLQTQVDTLDINKHVIFNGHRSDIAACIAGLDILVMCSDHEGLPMTLLEAMAIGTTVVGHSVGGIELLLQEGKCGWPVLDHQPGGYALQISDALANLKQKAARNEAASHNIRANYSAEICAQRHISLYREAFRH